MSGREEEVGDISQAQQASDFEYQQQQWQQHHQQQGLSISSSRRQWTGHKQEMDEMFGGFGPIWVQQSF